MRLKNPQLDSYRLDIQILKMLWWLNLMLLKFLILFAKIALLNLG